MENKKLKDKIMLDMLIDEHTEEEKTEEATKLKIKLIKMLINEPIEYINVINYYYDIINLNNKEE